MPKDKSKVIPLFSSNKEIKKYRLRRMKSIVAPKLKFWYGYMACALWKPEFDAKFKVGDVVKFFVGKSNIRTEDQKLKWIRLAGIGRVFGFYDEGYYIKPLRYFIDDKKFIERILGLHNNWVHNAPKVFEKFRDKLMIWSVS